ncbi:aminoacyl-tRNA deacylase [Alcaligenes endophyticus]|uniref:Cys-tRNA(Pro)/Cys-tRNA(Cys) deacylase n=1 Tax=Alcaligenes endophyticus TaxID=1929088 RepID=A0ABT8EMR8_9BURK|nr:aminoacyl-tRNA deacylase [Alcaligenes endophyticus]MCX5591523.1 aminoacyl-tRNA deacylase [Alcaligenes endophyticus]MDN4122596.1 aminoacyl-tRNA deacylase [Alcaligenes endophyticus]
MAKSKHNSETPATQWLRKQKIVFTEHNYDYVDRGGAAEAARQLGVALPLTAKTLVMEDELGKPLIVVMPGDKEVSTKNLARQLGLKKISPCQPEQAQRHSGYLVGGTSPFATRKTMPVYIEEGLLACELIYINGGRRGYLLGISPQVLVQGLNAKPVQVALDK